MIEESIFICDNCEAKKRGVMSVGDGQLCLDCYQKYSQAQSSLSDARSSSQQFLADQMTWADEMIAYQLGFRTEPPKMKSTARRDIVKMQNINLNGAQVGFLNTGSGSVQANTISTSLVQQNFSNKNINELLKELCHTINKSDELSQVEKNNFVESIDFLSDEMQKPKEKRYMSMITSAIEKINSLVSLVESARTLWNACLPIFHKLFGI